MPSKYIVKEFGADNYYHVFNRGVNKQSIFLDEADLQRFLRILQRYLDPDDQTKSSDGLPYRKYCEDIELHCYCLMRNHIHLLVHQKSANDTLPSLMRSVSTAYVKYFNKKYQRVGPLFQSTYKASRISEDSYLQHITRYIHMNPHNYRSYKWSSLPYYLGSPAPNSPAPKWISTEPMLGLFEDGNYLKFLEDYEAEKELLEDVKAELADQ